MTHDELRRTKPPGEVAAIERELVSLVESRDLPVPPYPAVAVRVHELLGKKDSGLSEVAQVVGADQALAASILRCANSAMYRRGPAAVTDLMQAVTRIGAQEVIRLLLASGLSTHAQALGALAPVRRLVWIEGLASAAVCQELARLRGLKAEEAFVIGLLHDFGKVVATAALEQLLETVLVRSPQPVETWAGVLERHHVPVGMALAERWNLPPLVRDVIASHHGEGKPPRDRKVIEVVQLSDEIIELAMTRTGVAPPDLAAVKGLSSAAEREAVARVLEEVPEFVAAFETPAGAAFVGSPRIDVPESVLAGEGRPVNIGVSVSVAHRPRLYTATAVKRDGLVMKGQEPLPEHRLLQAKVYAEEPLAIWALTRLCRRTPDGYAVELQPFGLSGPARTWWRSLVDGPAQA
ncbi:MAG: HDOD domain-containing protein [Anaeromyxobacteraceae bacterium]